MYAICFQSTSDFPRIWTIILRTAKKNQFDNQFDNHFENHILIKKPYFFKKNTYANVNNCKENHKSSCFTPDRKLSYLDHISCQIINTFVQKFWYLCRTIISKSLISCFNCLSKKLFPVFPKIQACGAG